MIRNKSDLLYYLQADKQRLGMENMSFLKRKGNNFFNSERTLVYSYLIRLRKTEYYFNTRSSFFNKVLYYTSLYRLKNIGAKVMINIGLNTVGPGLAVYHMGGITINPQVKIGSNFGLQTGVVIGQTKPGHTPVIGDNVYFGPGAKAFGKIKIGNNVTVAPNSVVTKDVPDDCIVSGVPAVIIKDNRKKLELTNI
jgi:serine O-acetyltransferase